MRTSSKSGFTVRALNRTLNLNYFEKPIEYGKRYIDDAPVVEVKKKYRDMVNVALAGNIRPLEELVPQEEILPEDQ